MGGLKCMRDKVLIYNAVIEAFLEYQLLLFYFGIVKDLVVRKVKKGSRIWTACKT